MLVLVELRFELRASRRHSDCHCRLFGRMGRRGACDETYPHASQRSSKRLNIDGAEPYPLRRAVRVLKPVNARARLRNLLAPGHWGESGHWCRSMLLVRFSTGRPLRTAGVPGQCNPGAGRNCALSCAVLCNCEARSPTGIRLVSACRGPNTCNGDIEAGVSEVGIEWYARRNRKGLRPDSSRCVRSARLREPTAHASLASSSHMCRTRLAGSLRLRGARSHATAVRR